MEKKLTREQYFNNFWKTQIFYNLEFFLNNIEYKFQIAFEKDYQKYLRKKKII